HTRFSRDWSSDVCSSDLWPCNGRADASAMRKSRAEPSIVSKYSFEGGVAELPSPPLFLARGQGGEPRGREREAEARAVDVERARSEERRVGEQWIYQEAQ